MNFIVNIEIATSKIVGVVARRTEEDILTILASEIIPTEGCIRRGAIYNIDATAGKIKKLINLLENSIGEKIGYCYLTLNPKNLKGMRHKESKIVDKNPISYQEEENLIKKIKNYKPELYINYGVSNITYMIDGSIVDSLVGKNGSQISAECTTLIGPPSIGKSAKEVISNKNNIGIHSYIWSTSAQSALLLSKENMERGCLLLDLGAGTTTASIYKDGVLKYMITVPMGSNLITKDIKSLGFDTTTAEQYKKEYVNLASGNKPASQTKDINIKELNKIVKLRVDEILLNVLARLQESELFYKLDDGIFTTGGGSQLCGMTEYIENLLKLPTQKATPTRVAINNITDKLNSPEYYQILGSLLFARKNCQYIKPEETKEPDKMSAEEVKNEASKTVEANTSTRERRGFIDKIKYRIGQLTFNDGEDNNEQQ